MSPLVPGKPSSPCREQKRSVHPSLTEFLTILHTKPFFFHFGTGNMSSPGKCYRKQFIWRRHYWHGTQPGLISANDKCRRSNLYSSEFLRLLRERRQENERWKFLFLVLPSPLCFLSVLGRRRRPVGEEQKASAMLHEALHAALPPGGKSWPQAERLRTRRVHLSMQTAFITWYRSENHIDVHVHMHRS